MRKFYAVLLVLTLALSFGCGSSKSSTPSEAPSDGILEKDRVNISLLNQIRRLKGVTIQGGVPIFAKGSNSAIGNSQPLYVVDDYVVGNSFNSVKDLVNPMDVKSIDAIQGADASFYGSRGASGVIVIKTKS